MGVGGVQLLCASNRTPLHSPAQVLGVNVLIHCNFTKADAWAPKEHERNAAGGAGVMVTFFCCSTILD